jgi:hypothetical protein
VKGWDTAAVVSDTLSAQAVLGRLAAEGVPARLQSDTALLGAVRQCRILVPASIVAHARVLLWQSRFTDEELASLALGETDSEPAESTQLR